ncbi:MAG: flagellar hook-length control protein FliK [Oxalobacter sp.]|nr:MAG: flagellar hook-length control protein FliK [Oxalobacter sp.]
MLLRTDVTGPRPVAATDATTTITSITSASQETLNRLALISAGKQFQAQILSRLNDGTYLVRVADTTARMPLPGSPQAGDMITLTLLSANPRPTFILGETSGAVEETIGNVLQNTGRAAQIAQTAEASGKANPSSLPEQTPTSATATLSSTGRLVDNLLHAAQLDGAPTHIRGQTPILPAPQFGNAAEIAQLAQSLQKTIERSGLFYESHVAQWVAGERSIEELMQEPQARTGNMPGTSLFVNPAKAGQTLLDVLQTLEAAQQTGAEAKESSLHNIALNNETARLISQQLAALEHRRIEWQGELWPGKRFEWEITEDTPQQQSEAAPEPSWQSTVRFDMPVLGKIAANIQLSGGRIQMHIRTSSDDSAARLRANGGTLVKALEAAGSPLDLLTVSRHEPA